ncbi:MAG: efflux RND transporter periplasmic adaptor subunit, partial [Saprospiraceae bacterium]|nr:efflux RND transporter periplasmic adaptor subunit [Saprospiraceae bacterium]
KSEKLSSAKSRVDVAGTNRDQGKANLEKVLKDKASQEFLDAEKSVSNAQTAFLIADQVLAQAKSAQNNEVLQNYAQDQYNLAENELKTAQANYKRLLATQAAKDVLEARARTRISQESYDRALDYYNSLLSGDQSLQVNVADSGVKQAEAALAQAKAALAVIDVQMDKTITRAPMDGVVLTRNLELGEMVSPGSVVMGIGQLVELELVVYIPETDYGKVKLGDQVSITTDSFSGTKFMGKVVNISDQAEFTPRNVQTIDGRRATVYAIKLNVPNPDLKLKPGMPADVSFDLAK